MAENKIQDRILKRLGSEARAKYSSSELSNSKDLLIADAARNLQSIDSLPIADKYFQFSKLTKRSLFAFGTLATGTLATAALAIFLINSPSHQSTTYLPLKGQPVSVISENSEPSVSEFSALLTKEGVAENTAVLMPSEDEAWDFEYEPLVINLSDIDDMEIDDVQDL